MISSSCVEYYKQQKQQLHCEEYRHNVIHSPFTKFHKKNAHTSQFNTKELEKFLKPPSKRIHYHMLKNKCMIAVIVIKCIKPTIEAII